MAKAPRDLVAEWQSLRSSAILLRHGGDIHSAIDEMTKAITVARTIPNFEEQTSTDLNYLAAMHLDRDDLESAEIVIREAIDLSRRYPFVLCSNLRILAEVERRKGGRHLALVLADEARKVYLAVGHAFGVKEVDQYIEWIKSDAS